MSQDIHKGKILVAMPKLHDPNFRQTVVVICEHGPEGSLGLVLNRPTHMDATTLFSDFSATAHPIQQVYYGGPVAKEGMLVLCHGQNITEGHSVLNNVFLAKDLEILKIPGFLGPKGKIRCFLGYAGWSPGQLEAELHTGAWHLKPANPHIIFDQEPDTVWQRMMRGMGKEWEIYSTMPADPHLN